MPVLDAHVHLGRSHLSLREVDALLKRAEIDGAAVFADPESGDLGEDNRYVLESAMGRELLFPYLYIGGNPYSGTRSAEGLPPPAALAGFRGVKWHCWFTPGHDGGGGQRGMTLAEAKAAVAGREVEALMEAAASAKIPVLLEEHFDLTRFFVERYPETIFVIPHMGMLNGGSGAVLAAFVGADNVAFDTSLAVPDASTIRKLGTHRVLFGSDFPYGDPASTLLRVRALGLAFADEEAVLGGNLLRLLNVVGDATRKGMDP